MVPSYRFVISHRHDDDRCAVVDAGLTAFNDSRIPSFAEARLPGKSWEPLHVFLEDSEREVLGGATGRVHRTWGWLHVENLCVDEVVRGQQYGRVLMQCIETDARALGCRHADLRTFDFQALGFYQKLGYGIVGHLDDFPEGHTFYWLRKDFE